MSDFLEVFLVVVFWAFFSIYLESIHFWNESWLKGFWHELWICLLLVNSYHEQDMGKGTPEVGSVNIVALLFWHVNLLTSWTVDFDSWSPNLFTHSDRKYMLPFTQDSGANAKHTLLELFFHQCQSLLGHDKPRMNQSIDISGLLINGQISKT